MHSIIPHQHSNELGNYDQSEAFDEADGLMDYVKLLFLTDLGEGHMETFDQGEQFDFESEFQIESSPEIIPYAGILPSTDVVSIQLHYQNKYTDDVPIVRQYFLSHIDFRGPPTQV